MQRFIVVAVFLAAAMPAHARTWHVPADAPTIQAGIDSALVGDVVELAPGTYHEVAIQMKPGITLRGGGTGPDGVVLDAQGTGRIMGATQLDGAAPTRIADLTFTHAGDGALYCSTINDLTIENCVFRENRSDGFPAGGISIHGARDAVLIRDCLFVENSGVGEGGALRLQGIDTVEVVRCLFIRNHVEGWGAAVSVGYTGVPGAVLDQCTFVGNTAGSNWAGVMKVGWGNIALRRSIVAFNDLVTATTGSDHFGSYSSSCSDFYANWHPEADLAILGGDQPNAFVDPCFCDADDVDFHLSADSWCLPGVGPLVCEEQMGALGEGCAAMNCQEAPVDERSWSSVKDLFD